MANAFSGGIIAYAAAYRGGTCYMANPANIELNAAERILFPYFALLHIHI